MAQLPPLSRLALAYAPSRARADWLTLLSLDARLAGVVRQAREPILAQLRLAWWRDRLGGDPAARPPADPLLAWLTEWDQPQALGGLIDGWEALLGEAPLGVEALSEFVDGRIAAMSALAQRLQVHDDAAVTLGRRWACADLALNLRDPIERADAVALLGKADPAVRTPRPLRPLSLLAGLSERAVRRGAASALSGPGALLAAIRLGITGSSA
ncbi:MAG: hypothetical protein V4579_02130 [Pseudomonadota bacterium]